VALAIRPDLITIRPLLLEPAMPSAAALDKNFRLPDDVRPSRYRARIAPDVKSRAFSGDIAIDLTLGATRRQVTLHGIDLEVTHAQLVVAGPRTLEATATTDGESQTITFSFPEEVAAGEARLQIAYRGKFNPALRGLYLAGELVTTQFEAADARRAFPCFDEPPFKARWSLAVELSEGVPADTVAISNSPVISDEVDSSTGHRVIEFAETRLLSSYLIALVVGKLASSAVTTVRNVPIRTWAVPSKIHLAGFGQECAAAVLPLLEDYFAVPYPFGKLDQIGIPDFEAGAMENAGAITYREVLLLSDPKTGSLALKKRVAEVITHELSHQWFGNLVTMVWWDDLWLNEAFATWMAYKIVDQWRPEWRVFVEFEGGKASGLALDALNTTHPIHAEVHNADEASENFDAITYEKGGAVLRMIEGYLGEPTFREGLRRYIRRHENGNARAADLWRALGEASGQPVEEVAESWIGQPGFPLLDVTLEGDTVRLAQRRFYADPALFAAGSKDAWIVPVVLRFADAAGVHEHRLLLREREATIKLPAQGQVAWLCANARGAGFYRTGYDRAGLQALAANFGALDVIERMNVIVDQWALVRAGVTTIEPMLELLAGLGDERDHAVLDEVVARLQAIEYRLLDDADRPAFARFVESLFAPLLDEVGWDPKPGEDDETRLRRAAAVRALGILARQPAVVEEAGRRAQLLLAGGAAADKVEPNLQDTVVYLAARAGGPQLFEELGERARKEADPAARRRYLLALASFETLALAHRGVALVLDELVPLQEISSFVARLLENRSARDKAWGLLRTQWADVQKRADSPGIQRRMLEALPLLPEARHVAEVDKFVAEHPMPALKQTIAQTQERMRLDAEMRARVAPVVAAWLKRR
jgi:puromycin-sensitive aminopeptidase